MDKKNKPKYFKARLVVIMGKEKMRRTFLVSAQSVNEADAKIKMHISKSAADQGVDGYELDILGIVDGKIDKIIS